MESRESPLRSFFASEALAARGKALHDAYVSARPFPHVALDGFLPEQAVREAARSVGPPGPGWVRRERDEAVKWGLPDEERMAEPLRALIRELQSAAFLGFLTELTGIQGLFSDPYLEGGGVHQIERGGYLHVHADFNLHSRMKVHRRLNLLLFLNEEWREEYGGHLELWETDMSRCVQRYLPVFNRAVVFNVTDVSFHGHPYPLACPEGTTRRSIALYYYTAQRPTRELSAAHAVLYRSVPGQGQLGDPAAAEAGQPPAAAARGRGLRRLWRTLRSASPR
jgi:hypothetical protein